MSNVVIFGATSAIAQEVGRNFAREGARLFLIARDDGRLALVAADLRSHGASSVDTYAGDLTDGTVQDRATVEAFTALGTVSHALVAQGILPDQQRIRVDAEYARSAFAVNFLSVAAVCMQVATRFEHQNEGCLAVIGSVAGDRIRPSNYAYGAAKGAVDLLAQGLRMRLAHAGVRVLTIKPGFVDTPMTADIRKGPLFSSPRRVGAAIYRAMAGRRNGTLYVPPYWRLIMGVIRMIPTPILRRLPL